MLEEALFRLDAKAELVVGASVDPVAGDVVTGLMCDTTGRRVGVVER